MKSLLDTLRNLGPAKLATLGAVVGGLLIFAIFLATRLGSPTMGLLYGNLDIEDSAEVVAQLESRGVPYEIHANGSQILVPQDRVLRLRMAMAEEGLPKGGSIGYEIFDRPEGFGTTDFVQNVNLLRALEGELARSIASFDLISSARVHLVLPRRELFSRTQSEPSASIVLNLRGGRTLPARQVQAIQQLVASAVPSLEPGRVAIADDRGNLLARGDGSTQDGVIGTSRVEEMRVAYENRLKSTVTALLEESVGRGNVRAEVSVDMDFDRVTINSEIYDPDGQVVRSRQTIEESENSRDTDADTAVTASSNLPDAGGNAAVGGSESSSARTDQTVNYEISRTVRNHVREGGQVERISVAVLVDGFYEVDENGEQVYRPRDQEELDQLQTLVRNAIGFDADRGDSVEVVNMRFAQPDVATVEEPFLGLEKTDYLQIAEMLVLAVVAILVILLVLRPLVSRAFSLSMNEEAEDEDPTHALTGPEGQQAQLGGPATEAAMAAAEHEGESMIDISQVEGRVRASSLRKIAAIVDRHPDEALSVLRSWLSQET